MATYPLIKDSSTLSEYVWVRGWGQSPFTNSPLPYSSRKNKLLSRVQTDGPWLPPDSGWWAVDAGRDQATLLNNADPSAWPLFIRQAHAKAMGKLQGEFAQRAELGAALGEWRSSASTIAIRASQLRRAYSNLRRGRFRQFIRELGVPRVHKRHQDRYKTGWSRPKDAAALWLEYWFGWSPMVNDIYTATEVLMSPVPERFEPFEFSSGSSQNVNLQQTIWGSRYSTDHEISVKQQCFVKVGGRVKVTNPNLFYMNALGLLNPVSIGWELIPFSFVADWFSNIGQLLQATTWDVGVSFEKQYTSVYLVNTCHRRVTARRTYPPPDGSQGGLEERSVGHCQKRTLGLVNPAFVWRAPVTGSVTRAATQISLLVSLFTRG